MTNEQYKALWNVDDGSITFLVVDIELDQDLGNIVASSWGEAASLLERGIERGGYSHASIIIEYDINDTIN
jgi:hypothetical protein